MTVTRHPRVDPDAALPQRPQSSAVRAEVGRSRCVPAALVLLALGLAVLVGTDGSPGWQAGRVALVAVVTAGALTAERRRQGHAIALGASALLAGVVGLVAGLGIGVMHVVKGDLDVRAIAGLAALAAGTVLIGAGSRRLWRATPGWWRVLAVPVAYLLLQFGVLPGTTAVYATNLPATPLGDKTPADRGLSYRDVRLTTTDDVRLAAWYVPSTNGAAVALLHGAGSNREDELDHAVVLARHGYGVLLVDARGHGQSGGVAMDLGWWGDRDVDAAITWLASSPDVTDGRIGAVGLSMGGEEAIGAAATDPRIRAVVTEGALWRGSMDTRFLPTDFAGWTDRIMLAIQTKVTGLLTSAPEPSSLHGAIAAIAPRPVLLIAGQPELRGDRYLRDAAPGSVELWELPDTPHVGGLSRHPAAWEQRVTGFLDRALARPAS